MISNGRSRTKDRNKFSAVDNARERSLLSASPLISWRLRSPMLISERCITALRETSECRRSFIGSPSDTGASSGRNLVCASARIMLILPHIRDKRRRLCYEPKARRKWCWSDPPQPRFRLKSIWRRQFKCLKGALNWIELYYNSFISIVTVCARARMYVCVHMCTRLCDTCGLPEIRNSTNWNEISKLAFFLNYEWFEITCSSRINARGF